MMHSQKKPRTLPLFLDVNNSTGFSIGNLIGLLLLEEAHNNYFCWWMSHYSAIIGSVCLGHRLNKYKLGWAAYKYRNINGPLAIPSKVIGRSVAFGQNQLPLYWRWRVNRWGFSAINSIRMEREERKKKRFRPCVNFHMASVVRPHDASFA